MLIGEREPQGRRCKLSLVNDPGCEDSLVPTWQASRLQLHRPERAGGRQARDLVRTREHAVEESDKRRFAQAVRSEHERQTGAQGDVKPRLGLRAWEESKSVDVEGLQDGQTDHASTPPGVTPPAVPGYPGTDVIARRTQRQRIFHSGRPGAGHTRTL